MLTANMLPLCGALWFAPSPQEPPAIDTTPDRTLVRAAADLRKVAAVTAAHDHTFAGSCTVTASDWPEPTVPFTVARSGDIDWLRLADDWVVTSGTKQLVRKAQTPWQLPAGDAPELPLTPLLLLAHVADGTLLRSEPSSHADRPALRAVVLWTGKEAKLLLDRLWVPGARPQRQLEMMANAVEQAKYAPYYVIDAALSYDPATHTLLAASLRVALIDPDAEPTTDDPDPPSGLRPLPKRITYQYGFELTRIDASSIAWPELGAADRTKLSAATRR